MNDIAKFTLNSDQSKYTIDASYKSNCIKEELTVKKFTGTDIDFKSTLKFADTDLKSCLFN